MGEHFNPMPADEQRHLLSSPEAIAMLMTYRDMQQDQADNMDAGCVGDITRWEELRQLGAKIIEADPGIWPDELRRQFELTDYRRKWIARAPSPTVPSGVPVAGSQAKAPADADGAGSEG